MLRFKIFKNKQRNQTHYEENIHSIRWPDHVVALDEKTFDEFIKKYPLSIVDFWAPWCTPCRAMAPRLRRLSKIYDKKVAFGKLNTEENREVAKKYKIMGIPHLIFFRYGKKIMGITGVKSVGDLKDTINRLLKK